jgi:hypothetical protein
MLLSYREAPGARYGLLLRLVVYLQASTPRPIFMSIYVVMRIILKHDEYRWHIRIPSNVQVGREFFISHLDDIGIDRRAI